jgi:hypothetical protein
MNPSKKIFRSLFVAAIGSLVTIRFVGQIDHDRIFDDELNFIAAIVVAPFLILVFVKDIIEYKKYNSLFSLIPTLIALFFLTGLSIAFIELKQKDNSPVKFSFTSKMVDCNGVYIDFREDATYKICSWSLGADYYRGTYILRDSIISLNNLSKKAPLQSNLLVIRSETISPEDTTTIKSIYQIDKTGNVIKDAIEFDLD